MALWYLLRILCRASFQTNFKISLPVKGSWFQNNHFISEPLPAYSYKSIFSHHCSQYIYLFISTNIWNSIFHPILAAYFSPLPCSVSVISVKTHRLSETFSSSLWLFWEMSLHSSLSCFPVLFFSHLSNVHNLPSEDSWLLKPWSNTVTGIEQVFQQHLNIRVRCVRLD